MSDDDKRDCGDCGVAAGQPHEDGCDVARCLETGWQRLVCAGGHDCGWEVWTGEWPGMAECREFGWWSIWSERGWERVPLGTPGATEDLNRLRYGECTWDRDRQRWVRR